MNSFSVNSQVQWHRITPIGRCPNRIRLLGPRKRNGVEVQVTLLKYTSYQKGEVFSSCSVGHNVGGFKFRSFLIVQGRKNSKVGFRVTQKNQDWSTILWVRVIDTGPFWTHGMGNLTSSRCNEFNVFNSLPISFYQRILLQPHDEGFSLYVN